MNFEEIINELKKFYTDSDDWNESEDNAITEFADDDGNDVPNGVGGFVEVEQHGGPDEGSDWWSIKFFKDHNIYIQVDGYYSSYNGTVFENGWESCTEVFPHKKEIIYYSTEK